jgi:hypothetical protein
MNQMNQMAERSEIFLKKPEKAQIFVWEPIEPTFLAVTPSKPKKT